jgi:putative tryptophan/tyrosine transport system substrate-binding protein
VRRRQFILGVSGSAAWPLAAQAQQTGRVRRVGILMPADVIVRSRVEVFRQELARLGWSEGSNVQFYERWSTDNLDLVRADAAALLALNPDVIFTQSDRVLRIFTTLTSSVPIVVALVLDPVASGAVESLARPGRNVTGFSVVESSIVGKMLETLKQIVPGVSRVGMMHNPDNPLGQFLSVCLKRAQHTWRFTQSIYPSIILPTWKTPLQAWQSSRMEAYFSRRI